MIDLVTLGLVLGGYVVVCMYGLVLAVRLRRPLPRLRAAIIVAGSIGWVAFYLWSAGLVLPTDDVYDAARLASRLTHVPTIGALLALLRILQVEARAHEEAVLRELGRLGP